MDDVADLLDDMPEEERNTHSYGELLSRAITARVAAAEAGAAGAAAGAAAAPGGGDTTAAGAPVEPAVPAAAPAPAAPAAAAVVVAPDPEVESALALLAEPEPTPAPALLTDGLDLGADLLLGTPRGPPVPRGEQEEVDDFLASVLASPSPQKQAPLAALPPPPPAAPAAALAAANGAPAGQQPVEAAAPAPGSEAAAAAGTQGSAEGGQEGEGGTAAALPIGPDQRRLLHWHWANLEYGCSARLNEVSSGAALVHTGADLQLWCTVPPARSRLAPGRRPQHWAQEHGVHAACPVPRRSPPPAGTRTRMPAGLAARTAWWWAATTRCSGR